jgi:hypothetical protein
MTSKPEPKKRNTKAIGFSEEEYKEIVAKAKAMGVYPRQFIMLKVRGNSA